MPHPTGRCFFSPLEQRQSPRGTHILLCKDAGRGSPDAGLALAFIARYSAIARFFATERREYPVRSPPLPPVAHHNPLSLEYSTLASVHTPSQSSRDVWSPFLHVRPLMTAPRISRGLGSAPDLPLVEQADLRRTCCWPLSRLVGDFAEPAVCAGQDVPKLQDRGSALGLFVAATAHRPLRPSCAAHGSLPGERLPTPVPDGETGISGISGIRCRSCKKA